MTYFDGAEVTDSDTPGLFDQLVRIRSIMIDGRYRTVQEIHELLPLDPENSIQAQLRNMRKIRFGAFIVTKRVRKPPRLFEYHVRVPTADEYAAAQRREARAGEKLKRTDWLNVFTELHALVGLKEMPALDKLARYLAQKYDLDEPDELDGYIEALGL